MRKHLFIYSFLLFSSSLMAQSGIVFRDANGNGIKDTGERGAAGVLVKSYTNNGVGDLLYGTATTNELGNYSLSPAAPSGTEVRIEFELPLGCVVSKAIDFEAHKGIIHGTSVQFITGAPNNVNFAIYSPLTEYLEDNNPFLYTSVYAAGNPTDATVKESDGILGFKQQYEGIPGDTINGSTARRPVPLRAATFGDVGTTWGIAYSKHCKKIFSSAFMKRHAGLGPLGSGGIYMIDPSKPTNSSVNNFFSLDTDLNIATQGTGTYTPTQPGFSPVIGSNADRKLKGIVDLSTDMSAFGQVGKVSLGGLELSDDGRYLFVVNLYDRKVYRIDLKDAKNPQKPTPSDVKVYNDAPWLTATCASGVARPFGIKFYKGKLYVGVVCTGENLGKSVEQYNANPADQVASASVYEFSPDGTGTGSNVLDIPLNYPKNLASKFENGLLRGWFNWTDNFNQVTFSHSDGPEDSVKTHPQPMLCDIEFDIDGSMITSFADRSGHQMGWRNRKPSKDTINKISCTVSGEILRAWKNPTTCLFELENNGTAGPYTTAGANKPFNLGGYPGTGEYYFGDDAYTLVIDQPKHGESVIGGIALSPATGEVIAAAFDPLDGRAGKTYQGVQNGLRASYSGGPIRLNNVTGDKISGYSVYTAAGFGKAAGIGDMEIISQFAPITLGNRIWNDTDADGIQDADELGFDGIKIDLYKGVLKVGETISASGGQWYFDSTNVVLNSASGIEPQTDYSIKIDTSFFKDNGKGALSGYYLTKKDQTASGLADLSDSDGGYENGEIVINIKTGDLGYTNYSLDIGLTQNPPCNFLNASLDSIKCNNNGTLQDTTDDFISFTLNPTGLNMWITYDVKVSKGTISPTSGNVGESTKFHLQAGSSGGGDVILTIVNPVDTSCKMQVTLKDPGACGYTCPNTTYDVCVGDVYRLEIDNPTYTQIQWYVDKGNGVVPIVGANGLTYDATEPGIYTYTALEITGCSASQCCPIILKASTNCCKPKICGSVKITKK